MGECEVNIMNLHETICSMCYSLHLMTPDPGTKDLSEGKARKNGSFQMMARLG